MDKVLEEIETEATTPEIVEEDFWEIGEADEIIIVADQQHW